MVIRSRKMLKKEVFANIPVVSGKYFVTKYVHMVMHMCNHCTHMYNICVKWLHICVTNNVYLFQRWCTEYMFQPAYP